MGAALGSYQADLYAAEAETINLVGIRWRRLHEVRAYLDGLVDSDWFAARWPTFVGCAAERRGRGSVWSTCRRLDADAPGGLPTEGVVLLADGALDQPTVLHELAHLLAPPGAGHGPPFAEILLALVRHEMGFFAFADLYHALRRRPSFGHVGDGTGICPSA